MTTEAAYSLHGATVEIDDGVLSADIAGRPLYHTLDEARKAADEAIRIAHEVGWIGTIVVYIHDDSGPIDTRSA